MIWRQLDATNIISKFCLLVNACQRRDNGAMIEVFYEILNYEVFSEAEAYGVSMSCFLGI